MLKVLHFFRLLGLFPRQLKSCGENNGTFIGNLSLPFLLYSTGFLALKMGLVCREIGESLAFFKNHTFTRALSLAMWSISWIIAEVFIALTLVLKHKQLCYLVQSVCNFQHFVERISLSNYQKLVLTGRLVCHLLSSCTYYTEIKYSQLSLFNYHSSFGLFFSFQVCCFIITNSLSKVLKVVVQEDRKMFFERVKFDCLAKKDELRCFRKYLRKVQCYELCFQSDNEDDVRSTFMLTKFVDDCIRLTADVVGPPILVYLLYCLIGFTLTMFNLIASASLQSHMRVLDYTAYCADFVFAAHGFADLSRTMDDEV